MAGGDMKYCFSPVGASRNGQGQELQCGQWLPVDGSVFLPKHLHLNQ